MGISAEESQQASRDEAQRGETCLDSTLLHTVALWFFIFYTMNHSYELLGDFWAWKGTWFWFELSGKETRGCRRMDAEAIVCQTKKIGVLCEEHGRVADRWLDPTILASVPLGSCAKRKRPRWGGKRHVGLASWTNPRRRRNRIHHHCLMHVTLLALQVLAYLQISRHRTDFLSLLQNLSPRICFLSARNGDHSQWNLRRVLKRARHP